MAKTQTFEELTREAARVERDLRKHDSPKASKLTAKAFVREAYRVAATSDAKLNALTEWMNEDNTPASLAFVKRSEKFITDSSTGICTRPPKNRQRLGFLGRDAAVAELAGTKFTVMELFALAARNAAKNKPTDFGTVDDPETFDADRERLLAKRAELSKRLAVEFTPADLRFEPHGHLARVTLTAGGVETYPTDTAAERLMSWAVAHDFY